MLTTRTSPNPSADSFSRLTTWSSCDRADELLRTAWLLGVDRRVLVGVLADGLRLALDSAPDAPSSVHRAAVAVESWSRGMAPASACLDAWDDLEQDEDPAEDARDPSPATLLRWSAAMACWAADAGEAADDLRRSLALRAVAEADTEYGLEEDEWDAEPMPSLGDLVHEGATHAATAMRWLVAALEASGATDEHAERLAELVRARIPADEIAVRGRRARFGAWTNWV